MGILNPAKAYETIRVSLRDDVCTIQIHRPESNNTINNHLIHEITEVLNLCVESVKVVVLEGLPEVFCFGADFKEIQEGVENPEQHEEQDPETLYNLWLQLASCPCVTVAHVRGKANAGGIGFVAACDLVLCEEKAVFSLSELLFGLMPACVLPFLIRRMGFSKSNYMTLMTQPISAKQAHEWGLVDAVEENSENLLRRHLLRLRRLSKSGIARYKRYMNKLDDTLTVRKFDALAANKEVFSDPDNLHLIARYARTGKFPWEDD
ncbi:enoyl-CoA hydratase/isomerase [Paraneptunicella aestuarii]|uniref:enoyl-CoA hydratase/isomerase n=1 Tax=Paraneptunicella aestuarii TaxID=2831148 RepID=UPI001E366EA3|nr:enoyl-CoA hydratase/isomerase [Paraneptunicella aestuarii]UAA37176.1 enoyl-CoA hydratase/isomerase [Paraneptunicella aestuarii]